jgi:UDP-N-acetylmuramoyl-tripeptide--D-alanyl-D-alanine ligase
VQAGSLFVALRGEKTDGHLYLPEAFARGAVAAIAEARTQAIPNLNVSFVMPDGRIESRRMGEWENRAAETPSLPYSPTPPLIFVVPDSLAGLQKLAAFWRAQMPAEVVAITGSVGKTTTKEITANVLAQRFVILRSEGNLNNEIGLPLTLLRLTPADQRVVLEMGMYALGEIAHLCQIARPRIGVVTNVGPTHLERLGSIERIAEAKSELVRALPPAGEGGVAVLNADDPLVRGMAGLTRARVFTYGLNPTADLWADEIVSEGLEGIRFRFHYGDTTKRQPSALHVKLPLLGRHSVHTALRAAAVGLIEGLSWTEIVTGLQELRGQLRLLVVSGLRETTLIDDTYNASPTSMLAALNLLSDIAGSAVQGKPAQSAGLRSSKEDVPPSKEDVPRCVAVLGDMLELGAFEEEGHRLVGSRAAQVVNKLVTVGQRARWIAADALAGGMNPADVYPTASNEEAIALLQGLIRPGDLILVKGSRGLAMESIVDALSRARKVEGPRPFKENVPRRDSLRHRAGG